MVHQRLGGSWPHRGGLGDGHGAAELRVRIGHGDGRLGSRNPGFAGRLVGLEMDLQLATLGIRLDCGGGEEVLFA